MVRASAPAHDPHKEITMKKQAKRLVLHRETVLCLQSLKPVHAALAGVIMPVPETSPLCVSTCCGSCDGCFQ
jgi:hypothetical protein